MNFKNMLSKRRLNHKYSIILLIGFPGGSVIENLLIPGLGRSSEKKTAT